MTILSKITLAAAVLTVMGAQAAAAGTIERGREERVAIKTGCVEFAQACANQLKERVLFCIADDRCSAAAPRPVSALIRYDARMDALAH
ncbi:MAG: hypothetical protein ACYC0C_04375 [Devosia sp.]